MPSCSVKWCRKRSTKSSLAKDGITFHRFPHDDVMKDIWIDATQREDFFPKTHSVICSRHFTLDCFEYSNNNRRRLFNSAVPTLYLPIVVHSPDMEKSQNRSPLSKTTKKESPEDKCSGEKIDNVHEENSDITLSELEMQSCIDHLIFSLNTKKKDIRRLQHTIRKLKKEVEALQNSVDVLTEN